MSLMDTMMDGMIQRLPREKKEEMMINMMPMMMEGIDINALMPRMMTEMLKGVTVDDVINFLKEALKDKDKFQELVTKLKEANLMQQMMFKTYQSKLNFEETVSAINEIAPQNGWVIPPIRDLQKDYQNEGVSKMTKLKIIYFCDAHGGYEILKEDKRKAMSVMMPMGVSVYETSKGQVEIAAMNLGMMSGMFAGATEEVFGTRAKNLEKTLEGIVE